MNEKQYRESLKHSGLTFDEATIQKMLNILNIRSDDYVLQRLEDIIILDDIVDSDLQGKIENHFITNNNWISNDSTLYVNNQLVSSEHQFPITEKTLDTPQLVDMIMFNGKITSDSYDIIKPILENIPIEYNKILRIKANLTNNQSNDADYYSPIHTDIAYCDNYLTGIYYISDSDGDTIIFNEKTGFVGNPTEKKRIKPKRGRLVLFDGNLLHTGQLPKLNNNRMVININIC